MGQVRKEGSTWYYVAELGNDPVTGKRKRKKQRGFKTKREAEAALVQVEAEVIHGTYIEPSKMLFKDYLEGWFVGKRSTLAEQSVTVYKTYLNNKIIPSLGHIPLSKLTSLHLQNFANELKEEDFSSKTIKKVFEIIRLAFEQAKDFDIVPKNVATKVKLPKLEQKAMEVWNEQEIIRFLQTAKDERYYLAFYLAITTGMRQGEILGLRWKDIDFESNTLCIRQTLKNNGKGFLEGGKTKASMRTVDLTEEVMRSLKKHKASIAKEKLVGGGGYQDYGLVVCTPHGTPLNPSNLRRVFNRLITKAEVPKITFHALRHTHATWLLSKGVNVKVISERLGHSNIKVTLDVYSHVLPTMQAEVLTHLDALLSNAK